MTAAIVGGIAAMVAMLLLVWSLSPDLEGDE